MQKDLQNIIDVLNNSVSLAKELRNKMLSFIKLADEEFTIVEFKLDRTEKIKKTTAILLEETIEELKQKRKDIEKSNTALNKSVEELNSAQIQLESKNRNLEIEASLERIRAVVLSMKETFDMIEMCRVISEQLDILNVADVRNVQTAVINETKGTFLNYEYYGGYDKSFITEIDYQTNPTQTAFITQMLTSSNAFFSKHFKRSELKNWLDHQRETDQFIDPHLEVSNSLNYYFHSIGLVALGISTYSPLNNEDLMIFQRFRNVFELAYRRFIDIELAMEQAREAQIETALERVRSKTMAMHKSNDLTSAVATLFEELVKLGLETIRLGIGIFHDGETKRVDAWTISSNDKSDPVQLSGNEMLEGHPLLDGIFVAWQNQHDYSYLLEGKDLSNYYNVVSDSNLPVQAPEVNHENARQYYHCVMFPAGGLFAFRESEFTIEAKQLMRRFADVFHLTFIRHLDLKKAEAQNKIIQAENERKSHELDEARELQLAMLPKELPQLPNLEIAVYMQTATEVGGDYYDFHVGSDGTLTAVIGDATGHGMKAGTMVTITKSLFDSLASEENILDSFSKISSIIKGMKFRHLSMCLTMLKVKGNRISFSSAAMPPVMIFRKGTKTVEEINMKGMPLGAFKDFPYQLSELELNSNDVILLMSDGFPELLNSNNEMFGYERTKNLFKELATESPEKIISNLEEEGLKWIKDTDLIDDITFVVIKVK